MATVNSLMLKNLRALQKVKQKAVADLLGGMPLSTYANKEKKGDFSEEEITMLVKFFKVTRKEIAARSADSDADISLTDLSNQIDAMVRIQKVQLKFLISICELYGKEGRNVSSEMIKQYDIAGILSDMDS